MGPWVRGHIGSCKYGVIRCSLDYGRRRSYSCHMASMPALPNAAPVADVREMSPGASSEAATRAKYDANRKRMAEALDGFIVDHRELLAALAK